MPTEKSFYDAKKMEAMLKQLQTCKAVGATREEVCQQIDEVMIEKNVSAHLRVVIRAAWMQVVDSVYGAPQH